MSYHEWKLDNDVEGRAAAALLYQWAKDDYHMRLKNDQAKIEKDWRNTLNWQWKKGELNYCVQLAADGGNDAVGHSPQAIYDYLSHQETIAQREGFASNARALRMLADQFNDRAEISLCPVCNQPREMVALCRDHE